MMGDELIDAGLDPCGEAQALRKALRDLALGVAVARVRFGEDDVTFRTGDRGLLQDLLADAERRCREAQGDKRRRRFAMGVRVRPY